MENVSQQITLIFNSKGEDSSAPLIDYVVTHVLRSFLDYDDKAGKKYFATDFRGVIDLRNDPRADVILFENIDTEEDLKEALRLVRKANRGARFFVPSENNFLKDVPLNAYQKVFTYSLDDHSANFYAYKIEENDEGGLTANVIYQPETNEKRSLMERLMKVQDSSVRTRFTISSCNRKDVLKAIKALAIGLSLSVEVRYVTGAVTNYEFGPHSGKAAPAAKDAEPARPGRQREKEVDFD